jgi:hypothetical protein
MIEVRYVNNLVVISACKGKSPLEQVQVRSWKGRETHELRKSFYLRQFFAKFIN